MTLVEQMWEQADREYEYLVETNWELTHSDEDTLKGKLRGYAECILIFMTPHFTDVDEVVREIIKRYQLATSTPEYETPGLGQRRFETARYEPSDQHKETQTKRNSIDELNARAISPAFQRPKDKSVAKISGVDKETQAAIKGLATLAEANDIAQIYGLSVETVEAIIAK